MGELDDNFKGRSQRLAYELGVALSLMTPIQKKHFNRIIFVERSRRGNAKARLQTQKKFAGYDPSKKPLDPLCEPALAERKASHV